MNTRALPNLDVFLITGIPEELQMPSSWSNNKNVTIKTHKNEDAKLL